MKARLLILCLFSFLTSNLFATSFTWNGSSSTNWATAANWTPSGVPSTNDTVTVVSATRSLLLDANRTVKRFTMTSGTFDLNTDTLTISTLSTFTAGTISNGHLKPQGTTATFQGTNFNCSINSVCGQLKFNGSKFNYASTFEQNGSATGTGLGGNVFNADVTIKNSGTAYLSLSTAAVDTFNAKATLIQTGSLWIQVAHGYPTIFNGNLEVNCTGANGIAFTSVGVGGATLASGKTITVGSTGFSAGTLLMRKFTQAGSTAQALTLTGTATISLDSTTFNGALTLSVPNYLSKYTKYYGSTSITKSSTTSNFSDGGNHFYADVTINNTASNTAALRSAVVKGDLYEGNLTCTTTTGQIQLAYFDTTDIKGNLSINHATKITFNNSSGTLRFTGSSNQSIGGSAASSIGKIIINKSSGTVTLNQPVTIDSLSTFTKGILYTTAANLFTLKASCTASGASIASYVDGPIKKIGNTAFNFPVGKGNDFRPVGITAPSSVTDAFTAEFFSAQQSFGSAHSSTINYLSNCSYWNLSRTNGTSNVQVTLNWSKASCDVFELASQHIAEWNGTQWNDLGTGTLTGDLISGTLKTPTTISTFGNFIFANNLIPTPSFTFAIDSTSIPTKVTFTNNSSGFSPQSKYLWLFGDQSRAEINDIVQATNLSKIDTFISKNSFDHYYYVDLNYPVSLRVIDGSIDSTVEDSVKLYSIKAIPNLISTNCQYIENTNFDDFINGCPRIPWNLGVGIAPPGGFLSSWYSPTDGTPDYLLTNACIPPSGIPFPATCASPCWGNMNSICGCGTPISGSTAVGMILYLPQSGSDDTHEYIQAPLKEPLKAGVTYNISFDAILGDASYYGCEIHASISTGPFTLYGAPFLYSGPLIMPIHVNSMNTVGRIEDANNWVAVSGQYTSLGGGEDHITIGNFHTALSSNASIVPAPSCNNWIYPTALNFFQLAYVWIDNVSLVPVPLTIAFTHNDINCSNSNIGSATAIGNFGVPPYTFLWNNGQTTNTISNLAAGTYTCTVTDDIGCIVAGSVTISNLGVNTAQTPIITGDLYDCSSNDVYVVSNVSPNAMYQYTVTDLNGIVLIPTTTGSTVNVSSAISSGLGFIVTFVLNSGLPCEKSSSISVYPCCEGIVNANNPSKTLTFTNTSISAISADGDITGSNVAYFAVGAPGVNTLSSHGSSFPIPFAINGTLTIDVDVIIHASEILMGPNAKIVVTAGHHLEFQNQVYIHSCGSYMWDGIYLEGSGSIVEAVGKTIIEDAKNAIVAVNGSEYRIHSLAIFNRNYKSIVLNNANSNLGNVTGAKFESVDQVLQPGTWNLVATPNISNINLPPYIGLRSQVGIEINNCKAIGGAIANYLKIGTDSYIDPSLLPTYTGCANCETNEFYNLDYGIKATNSDILVFNNIFKNIDHPTNNVSGIDCFNCPNNEIGTAIWAQGTVNGQVSNLIVGGSNSTYWNLNTLKNIFTNCKRGILSKKNIKNTVTYNQLDDIYFAGIDIKQTQNNPLLIEWNHFNRNNRGIMLVNDEYTPNGTYHTITHNMYQFSGTLTIPLAPNTANQLKMFVYASGNGAITPLSIKDNNSVTGVRTGIILNKINSNKTFPNTISNNTISMESGSNSIAGIRIINSTTIYIDHNKIVGTNPTTYLPYGISLESAKANNFVLDNLFDKTGTGIRTYNCVVPITLQCNQFQTTWQGLRLEGSTIGNQGNSTAPNDNQWVNNPNFDIYNDLFSTVYTWWTRDASNLPYSTTDFGPILNPIPISFQQVSPIPTSNCDIPCTNCKIFMYDDIISNNITYSVFNDEQLFMAKQLIYQDLDADTSLMYQHITSDSILQNFRQSSHLSNIGKLHEVDEYFEATDVLNGSQLNDQIIPTNNSDYNQKIVNSIYAETWAVNNFMLDSNQYVNLYSIAIQNPLDAGMAVYQARGMLDTIILDTLNFTGSRIKSATLNTSNTVLSNSNLIIYPNPTQGLLNIKSLLEDQLINELVITDLLGKVLIFRNGIAKQEETLVFSNAEAGSYILSCKLSNGYWYRIPIVNVKQ